MSTAAVPRVDVSSLNLGSQLGAGGQGRVVAVSGFLAGGRRPAALKLYSPEVLGQMRVAALEVITGLPGQLALHDSAWLLESTAWPAAIAEDRGRVCGFLMRAVPAAYHFGFRTQTQGLRQQLADVAFLLNPDSYVTSAGLVVSERHRLELLGSLAMTLSRLHVLGVAVGDLSPKNLLFSLAPAPGCFLLDCDAVQLGSDTVVKQVETPDWEAPAGEPLATTATDAYKFGLLAIRLFARDQSSRDKAPLAAVSPELGRLAGLSQHPSPSQRPQPSAWIAALDIAASTASARAAQPTTSSPRISVPSPPSPLTHPHPPHPASRSAGLWRLPTLAVL